MSEDAHPSEGLAHPSLTAAVASSKIIERTRLFFGEDYGSLTTLNSGLDPDASIRYKRKLEYENVLELPPKLAEAQARAASARGPKRPKAQPGSAEDTRLATIPSIAGDSLQSSAEKTFTSKSLVRRPNILQPKPDWHAPWKLMRVISGSMGWVRSLTVDPDNRFFVSGSGDRLIRIWDIATGSLKLSLSGHIAAVRGLAVSPRHPYLFSCGEDKMVKNWDLETNKVIRHYHGHLSGVYTLALHPTLDVLVTGGRDAAVRVWDMRTRSNVMVLSGHRGTVTSVVCQEADPQVISASLDGTVRTYDLAAGKTRTVLTNHKKGVRALATHPKEFTFASASAGSIKSWKCPEAAFLLDYPGHNAIINTLAVNEDNVLFSGGDNGSMCFWDWKTGHKFQTDESVPQPGSLEAEAGVMCSTFDQTGLRLIVGGSDKTIKMYRPDPEATPETHPLDWKPTLGRVKY